MQIGLVLPSKRHKGNAGDVPLLDLLPLPRDLPQRLVASRRSDRDHEFPAVLQLLNQGLGDVIGGTGDDDGIVGCMLFPAIVPVSVASVDVRIA